MHHTSQHDSFVAAKDRYSQKRYAKKPHPRSPAARKTSTTQTKTTKATAYSVDSNEGDSDDDMQLASLTLLYGNSARHSEQDSAAFLADLDESLRDEDLAFSATEGINANAVMIAFASQTLDMFSEGQLVKKKKGPNRAYRV